MPTPDEARRALALVTTAAVTKATGLLTVTQDFGELLGGVPVLIGTYGEAAAGLAADHYDDLREQANASRVFTAEPIVEDRAEKIRRGVLWAAEPLAAGESELASARMAEVVQLETARPFRTTILENRQRDPSAVGWRRNTSGKTCKFCTILADRGVVYRESTARFATHGNCDCTASPVFDTEGPFVEASVLQYVASQRRRTPAQREALRRYLAALPD